MTPVFITKFDLNSTLWRFIPVLEFLLIYCFYAILTKPFEFQVAAIHLQIIIVVEIVLFVATIFAIVRRNTVVLKTHYWFSICKMLYTYFTSIKQTIAWTSAISSDYGFKNIEAFYYGNSSEIYPGLFLSIKLLRDNYKHLGFIADLINDKTGNSVGNLLNCFFVVDLIGYIFQILLLNRAINYIDKQKVEETKENTDNEIMTLNSFICE